MKRIFALCFILVLFTGCTNSIDGLYVRVKDNDRSGVVAGIFKGLIEKLDFKDKHCSFEYFGMKMSGQYEIDKNYIFVNTGGDLGTLSFEIIDDNTLEGEGWAYGTFKSIKSFVSKKRPAIYFCTNPKELDVRAGQGDEYSKIDILPKGTKIKVVAEYDNGWCEIEKENILGFVLRKQMVKEGM